jgi:aminobenzoyl-glutamate utilization protein B
MTNTPISESKPELLKWHDHNTEGFYRIADEIWKNPELGMKETESAKLLVSVLRENGFQVDTGVADMPTAFIATFGSGRPVIAFSAEYDALPGLSQEVCTEKRAILEGAPGHGCGHNILGTAAVKAAIGLKYAAARMGKECTIKVFGTPAEELCIGKPFMAAAGLFQGVDVFLDWHPKDFNRSYAEKCNAYFNVKYHFKGKAAHGGFPWEGRSAFDAAMLQAHAVELLREHIPPGESRESANTINYVFSVDGISYPNVVPDHVTAWYVGRMTTSSLLLDVLKRVDQCAESAALATETEVVREFITASHEKICNEVISQVLHKNLEEIGAPEFNEEEHAFAKGLQKTFQIKQEGLDQSILPYKEIFASLQDTAEYTWFAPYGLLRITMCPTVPAGWHNWAVTACAGSTIARKTMDTAAKILTASAIDILEDPSILEKAETERKERMKGKEYLPLILEGLKPNLHVCD